jgi:hypothetical protein
MPNTKKANIIKVNGISNINNGISKWLKRRNGPVQYRFMHLEAVLLCKT